jgi:hypothetical protein
VIRMKMALVLSLAGVILATVFAVERAASAVLLERERTAAARDLAAAADLAKRHPRLFERASGTESDTSLKAFVQESAAKREVTIGFLSESEREMERGRRELQVLVRLTQARHGNLVRFLGDVEEEGAGARVREIHVRPSREDSQVYEEAEIVLAKAVAARAEKP